MAIFHPSLCRSPPGDTEHTTKGKIIVGKMQLHFFYSIIQLNQHVVCIVMETSGITVHNCLETKAHCAHNIRHPFGRCKTHTTANTSLEARQRCPLRLPSHISCSLYPASAFAVAKLASEAGQGSNLLTSMTCLNFLDSFVQTSLWPMSTLPLC